MRVRVHHLRQSRPWMRLATASDYACTAKKPARFIFLFSFSFLFFFFFYLFFFWSPDTSNGEFQSGYTFFVSRQKIVIYTNIRRIQARYRCSKRQSFQTGNKNCFILLYWGEKKQNRKRKSFERRAVIESFIWITLGDLLENFERNLRGNLNWLIYLLNLATL